MGENFSMKIYLKTDLAYCAGLLDGEGCLTISKRTQKNTFQMRVEIVNTNKEVLEWVKGMFGGSVIVRMRPGKYGNNKESFVWLADTRRAASFLRLIKPYVKIKRRQLEIALDFQRTIRHETGHGRFITPQQLAFRADCKMKMSALNKRGFQ